MNKKYAIMNVYSNGQVCKIIKAKSGGLELLDGKLDFGDLAVKVPADLFDGEDGNEIRIVLRRT